MVAAQTSSPATNDEYCPNVEYTVTVTITKAYSSMIGEGGCIITQLPTSPVGSTFTFKGKFADANQKQIFRVYFSDKTSYGFEFLKSNLFLLPPLPVQKFSPISLVFLRLPAR